MFSVSRCGKLSVMERSALALAAVAPFRLMKTSLIGLPFVWSSTVVAVLCLAALIVVHGGIRRTICGLLTVITTFGTIGAWVNHHYAYLPNVGSVFGWRAQDQASARRVERLATIGITGPVGGAVAAGHEVAGGVPRLSHGLVEQVAIPGTISGFAARSAQVYLPPAWFEHPRPSLPVIELLHGTPGTPEDWTRAGSADRTADRWAAWHAGVAPIIVMPDANGSFMRDTECVDGRNGRSETYLAVDVPAWVMARLGAPADRLSWTIAGSSEGGYCALDLALRHSERYGSFIDFSGLDRPTYPGGAARLFPGQPDGVLTHMPAWSITRLPAARPMAGWFEVGSADRPNMLAARHMEQIARQAGIVTHLVVVPGASHTWHLWRRAFADALPWAAARMQTAAGGTSWTPPAGPLGS